jgi:hypothetical protein
VYCRAKASASSSRISSVAEVQKLSMENAGQSSMTLSDRVRGTLKDLELIQVSLTEISGDDKGAEASLPLDLQLAAELKSVVDALRKLLWAYITALSAKSGRQPHEVLEWYKLELAVEMLRNTAARPAALKAETLEGTGMFQDLVAGALAVTAMHTGSERLHG